MDFYNENYIKAYKHEENGEYDKAIEYYTIAIELNPNNDFMYGQRANLYKKIGKYSEAAFDYIKEYKLFNHHLSIHYVQEICERFEKRKESDKAIQIYTEFIKEIGIDDLTGYWGRAALYWRMEEYEKAIPDYSIIIDLEPTFYSYYWRGRCYFNLGEYDKAINDLNNAMRFRIEEDNYYYWRGYCYFKLEKYEEAINDIDKAVKLNPNNTNNYLLRGTCCYFLKKYEDTINNLNKFIKSEPNNAGIYCLRGDCYRKLKEFNKAITDYTKALELGFDTNRYFNRAKCYFELADYKKAKEDCKCALEYCSDDSSPEKKDEITEFYNSIKKITDKKIEIATSTKEEIMSLDGITEEIADKFIKLRNSGRSWFDMETFAHDLNLQPHEVVLIEDRLIFPLKPSSKVGRIVDF